MNKAQRQSMMLELLSRAKEPVTGSSLSTTLKVSRQVIVKDIACLRDAGAHIIATPNGYRLLVSTQERVFQCRHIGREKLEEELYIMVDHGGFVIDVQIEHAVYGRMRTQLNLRTRRDVEAFVNNLYSGDSQPISALTDGIHVHNVRAIDQEALDAIEDALRDAGILWEEGGRRPPAGRF